jgi:hypothetical protein
MLCYRSVVQAQKEEPLGHRMIKAEQKYGCNCDWDEGHDAECNIVIANQKRMSGVVCTKCNDTGWIGTQSCEGLELCSCQFCECEKGRQIIQDTRKLEFIACGVILFILMVICLFKTW